MRSEAQCKEAIYEVEGKSFNLVPNKDINCSRDQLAWRLPTSSFLGVSASEKMTREVSKVRRQYVTTI
ncbi:hypothetical protein ACROYT_G019280 [Oculina patagonica]